MKTIKIISVLIFTFVLAITARAQVSAACDSIPNNIVLFKAVNKKIDDLGNSAKKMPPEKRAVFAKNLNTVQQDLTEGDLKYSVVKIKTLPVGNLMDPRHMKLIRSSYGYGSGFLIKTPTPAHPFPDGEYFIMTNAHVVENKESIVKLELAGNSGVRADGRIYDVGEIKAGDDFALIQVLDEDGKVEGKDGRFLGNMKPLAIAKAKDAPQPGDAKPIYSLGYPGVVLTFTKGYCENYRDTNVTDDNKNTLYNAFLMGVSNVIVGGASGSAGVNARKEVVGVVCSSSGDGVSNSLLPLPRVIRYLDKIAAGEKRQSPGAADAWDYNPIDQSTAKSRYLGYSGVGVDSVYQDSPLYKAGFKKEDRLLAVDGYDINQDGLLQRPEGLEKIANYCAEKAPGDPVKYKFLCMADSTVRQAEPTLNSIKNLENLSRANMIDKYEEVQGVVVAQAGYLTSGNQPQEVKTFIYVKDIYPEHVGDIDVGKGQIISTIITSVNGKNVSTIEDMDKALEENTGTSNYFKLSNGSDFTVPNNK